MYIILQQRRILYDPLLQSNPYQNKDTPSPYQIVPLSQYQKHSIQQPHMKVFCMKCSKQITKSIYITTTYKQQCIGCFSRYSSISAQQQYKIVQKKQFSIFQPTWTVYQQLLLLKSIEKWGFGNWHDIKQYMQYFGAKFTQGQIQTHYNTFYLSNKDFMPQFSQKIDRKHKSRQNEHYKTKKSSSQNPVSLASLSTHISNSIIQNFEQDYRQVQSFSNQQNNQEFQPKHLSALSSQKISGYNRLRKQFQSQFDPSAQVPLSLLQFREDDLPQQRQIKYKLLQQYNLRLSKRYQIQDFVIQQRLLDIEYKKQLQHTRTQYQKSSYNELKRFMRFSSFHQHNQFVRRFALEKQLKSVIQGLRCLRNQHNISKIKDIHQKLREQSIEKMIKRGRPRKVIHLDKQYQDKKINQNQKELKQKLNISMKDIQNILKTSQNKKNGDQFKYKNVKIAILEKG